METQQTITTEYFLEYLSSDGQSWQGPSANPFPSIATAIERSQNGWGFTDHGKARIRLKETVTTTCTSEKVILVADMMRPKNAKSRVCKVQGWVKPEGYEP